MINWHKKYPLDWKQTWFEVQKKWSSDIACAEGVFKPFNIDAKVNSAYVVMGLLYGNGDFTKSLEIATRCGQDADCNPSSVGGVLGTILGYKKIPQYWKMGLAEAEDIDFKYTTISLNKVYSIGFKHALQNIQLNGGKTDGDKITISMQQPKPVKPEQGFAGLFPVERQTFEQKNIKEATFDFEGTGFILAGQARKREGVKDDYIFEAEMYIDGKKTETAKLPTSFTTRRHELFWKYPLPKGKHTVTIKVLNPNENYELDSWDYIVYSDTPVKQKI